MFKSNLQPGSKSTKQIFRSPFLRQMNNQDTQTTFSGFAVESHFEKGLNSRWTVNRIASFDKGVRKGGIPAIQLF